MKRSLLIIALTTLISSYAFAEVPNEHTSGEANLAPAPTKEEVRKVYIEKMKADIVALKRRAASALDAK